ncbi:MAG: HAMP domain-containing histidine kinase [Candidatus Bathyarchaeota archaeon]|nr:HAMP domain-containing histidine kinase [Candidatus Bathyarchaeota archaeon]
MGRTPVFPSGEWLFIPMALAVAIAALSSLFKVNNFQIPFIVFMIGAVLSLAAFFAQFSFAPLRLGLMVFFMGTAVPIMVYIFAKSRGSADLHFLIATLCFLFEGVVIDLGTSVDIPVMLAIFGLVFIAFMFNGPQTVNPSSLPSFILLEKKLEEANKNLEEMEAKLLKAERLAAIGELAGIIGHDLRNPLQGIRSATYYLKTHNGIAKDDPVCKEMLDEIDNCIRRSDKIINDLIDYSQVITLHPSLTDPKTLTTMSLNQIAVPANIEIVNKTTDKPVLEVDVLKIEHAFVAIIKNALDAMPEGGKLTIKTRTSHNFVVFSFQDTGLGMNQETLSKLFTPMFTTKAKGMGFGLAVCKRFVEAHSGKIAVESTPNQGTKIIVAFPINYQPER